MGGVLLGLFVGVGTSCGSSSSDSGDSGSTADTTTSTEGSSQTSNTVTTGNVSASSNATASAATTSAGGSGGSSSDASTTTSTSTTGDGGGAGDASVTSNATSTSAGGSGGAPDGTCPNEPPVENGSCSELGVLCAYEDCSGAGRTVAECLFGQWSVETGACTEVVYCSDGSATCALGEICSITAGGAYQQQCVPNTCEGEAVDCDCLQGCGGDCFTSAMLETGITVTCDTCPFDLPCP